MKLNENSTLEDFVRWLKDFVDANGGRMPSEKEWKEIIKNLSNASKWISFWYVTPNDGGDDGGGEPLIPPQIRLDHLQSTQIH